MVLTTHPYLVPRYTERSRIPLLSLRVFEAYNRVKPYLTLTFSQLCYSAVDWEVSGYQRFECSYILLLLLLSPIYDPYEFEPPHSGGSEITHSDTP
jgi:hypothetical protein